VNWTKIDQDVFTTNRSIPVWCNVDPTKAYFGKAKIKEECDCKYDGDTKFAIVHLDLLSYLFTGKKALPVIYYFHFLVVGIVANKLLLRHI